MEIDHEKASQEAERLYKEKNYDRTLVILRELIKNEKASEWDQFRAGWCIYHTKFKSASGDVVVRLAHEILDLLPKEKRKTDLLAQIVALKTVDVLKNKRSNSGHARILELLDLLDPEALSEETRSSIDADGKRIEYASNREKYHAEKTKTLFELKKWDECLAACDKALEKIDKFHYDNDIWIKRRRALSLKGLGKFRNALSALQEIATKKHDWYIESELASIHRELGDHDLAWHHAVNASICLRPKDAKYGVNLFEFMGAILANRQQPDEAEKHFALAAAIRAEKGWPIPNSLQQYVKSKSPIPNTGSHTLLHELQNFWQSERRSWTTSVFGKIKTVLNDGANGFILGDDGSDYYFRSKSFVHGWRDFRYGTRVRFEAIKSFDKKKQRETLEAVRITCIEASSDAVRN